MTMWKPTLIMKPAIQTALREWAMADTQIVAVEIPVDVEIELAAVESMPAALLREAFAEIT
jgi:hypothetical protein